MRTYVRPISSEPKLTYKPLQASQNNPNVIFHAVSYPFSVTPDHVFPLHLYYNNNNNNNNKIYSFNPPCLPLSMLHHSHPPPPLPHPPSPIPHPHPLWTNKQAVHKLTVFSLQ